MAPFSFDWDNGGTGDEDDTQDLIDVPSGTYTVVMTDANGCSTIATIDIGMQLSIVEILENQLMVYPNPTKGQATIACSGKFEYQLTSIT